MTIEELNKIKKDYEELVMVRKVVKEKAEELSKNTDYRKQILVCGGTGCTSSGSKKVLKALDESLKKYGLDKEVLVVRTGCFGLCSLGPIMIVYPEGYFYAQTTPEGVKRIVKEHIVIFSIRRPLLTTILSFHFQKQTSIRSSSESL